VILYFFNSWTIPDTNPSMTLFWPTFFISTFPLISSFSWSSFRFLDFCILPDFASATKGNNNNLNQQNDLSTFQTICNDCCYCYYYLTYLKKMKQINDQIRVTGSVEPKICMKMLRILGKNSKKISLKYTWLRHDKNFASRWCFLWNVSSKPRRRSTTTGKQ